MHLPCHRNNRNTKQCFCGNDEDFARLGALEPESCDMLCAANPDEFCGGRNAIQASFTVITSTLVLSSLTDSRGPDI